MEMGMGMGMFNGNGDVQWGDVVVWGSKTGIQDVVKRGPAGWTCLTAACQITGMYCTYMARSRMQPGV